MASFCWSYCSTAVIEFQLKNLQNALNLQKSYTAELIAGLKKAVIIDSEGRGLQ